MTAASAPRGALELTDLSVRFGAEDVVRRASLAAAAGAITAVVGGSGSGKTLTGLALLGLVPSPGRVTAGTATLDGTRVDLTRSPPRGWRGPRIGMIFQAPQRALTPTRTIGEHLTESIRRHGELSGRRVVHRAAVAALERVQLADPAAVMRQYPHECSGGMAQRIMIALALVADPDLLIADEPTTALDAVVQAAILELLRGLARERGMATLLITHDLGVVAEVADRAVVMDGGRIVESAGVLDLFDRPQAPATRALLAGFRRGGERA